MRFTSRPALFRVCTTLALATSVLATVVIPNSPPGTQFPPHNPEQPDVAAIHPPVMDGSAVQRRDLLGGLLPLNPKSPDSPAAGEPASSPPPASQSSSSSTTTSTSSAPGGGGSAASMPPPPASPADPNHPKAANSGVLPGLLNGVLGGSQPTGTTNDQASPQTAPAGVNKAIPTSAPARDNNGDGVPDNQLPGPASSSNNNPSSNSSVNSNGSSSSSGELSPGVIALIVLFTLAILGAFSYSCYRICDARRRRRTRRFDDEDILRNHAGAVGYSAGGGYGVYMEKGRNDVWKNLDIFNRR
ncbi:hypothetical protein DFQ27_006428 [Actinomortierella ambigua]|uniref:Mid2 domain-containing protein n=1 Tax=Actinomortierella ambigua TaxID=1343610 RepID=A0A9P6PVU8_9FUNG|nr:hypothetical protein DFQ27_006428 [Actinomortierella ambigua]